MYKDECQYEVVYEEVCSVNYNTIRYKTECQYEVELPQEGTQGSEAATQTSQASEVTAQIPQGQEQKPVYTLPQADRLPKKTEADQPGPRPAFPPRLRVPGADSDRERRSAPESLSSSLRVPRFAIARPRPSYRPTPSYKPKPSYKPRPRPSTSPSASTLPSTSHSTGPCKKVPVREPVKTCRKVPRSVTAILASDWSILMILVSDWTTFQG